MCFTQDVTVALLVSCFVTGTILKALGFTFRQYQIFYVFFLMECIQLGQYLTLGDCSSRINQALTLLGWVHVCFQPLSLNYFAFAWEPNTDVVKAVMRMCLVGSCLMLLRAPAFLALPLLHKWLPWLGTEFPDPAIAGTEFACGLEAMCGSQLCTTAGSAHLRWSIPLVPTTYFLPGGAIHMFLFFVPCLVVPGQTHRARMILTVVNIVVGPLVTIGVSHNMAGAPWYRQEWPAFWCAYAPLMLIIILVYDVAMKVQDPRVPGTKDNLLYQRLVHQGHLFNQAPVMAPAPKKNQ